VATQMLSEIVARFVAPVMRTARFRKHRLTWNRRVGDLVHVVEVRESRWSDADDCDPGIWIGVMVNDVHRIVWDGAPPRVVREVDCLPRYAHGYIPGSDFGRYVGWRVRNRQEAECAGQEMAEAIRTCCLPALDRCRTRDDALSLAGDAARWQCPAERLAFAVLGALCGHQRQAESILEDMLQAPSPDAWRDRILGTRERLRSHLTG
jgi:hypothetical protein